MASGRDILIRSKLQTASCRPKVQHHNFYTLDLFPLWRFGNFLLALQVQRWHMTFVKPPLLAAARLDCHVCLHRRGIKCKPKSLQCLFVPHWCWMCPSVCVCSPQEKNSALALENESQREQYERCLDEVSVEPVYHTQGRCASTATCFPCLEKSGLFVEFPFMWAEWVALLSLGLSF